MKMRRIVWSSLPAVVLGVTACSVAPSEGEPAGQLATAIVGGSIEASYAAVGEVVGSAGKCTGTLIAQSYVLTSADCAGDNMVFMMGSDPSSFVAHPIDQRFVEPNRYSMVVHLAAPVEDVAPLPLNEGMPPDVGTTCTVVGYGAYGDDGGIGQEVRRSASVTISGGTSLLPKVSWTTGMADIGDTGAPLFCNGRITAVAHGNPQGADPFAVLDTYSTTSSDWVESVVAPVYTELALQNGWSTPMYDARNPAIARVDGWVRFKGQMEKGTNGSAFTLPGGYRPPGTVYVPVAVCGGVGRLHIEPDGTTTVETDGPFDNAKCNTSLDGASFALPDGGWQLLTLQNGWTPSPFNTTAPMAQDVGGVIQFRGAMATSSINPVAFTLPAELRPKTNVYVPVDLCNSRKGRLNIAPNGVVQVVAENSLDDAKCFTSLEGASFVRDAGPVTPLALQNGWYGGPYTTAAPGVVVENGIAHFKGGMATNGANGIAFTLPAGLRPTTTVILAIDLFMAKKGTLTIGPNGVATVSAASGNFADAKSFTSLDGASFAISDYTPMTLVGGWRQTIWNTSAVAAGIVDGVVQFKGAMSAIGGAGLAFVLPPELRPSANVYLPLDLCGGAKGQLLIQPSGAAMVSEEGGGATSASCFTSLDGVSFAAPTSGYQAISLQNGWKSIPGTRGVGVGTAGRAVHFTGAIANGTGSPFTLPAGLAPQEDTIVPVTLCNSKWGYLSIDTMGVVNVHTATGAPFTDATCMTSLEGATFVPVTLIFDLPPPINGWKGGFLVTNALGVVRFRGSAWGGTGPVVTTLPSGDWPSHDVYIDTVLCAGKEGRIHITPSGVVSVQAKGDMSDAYRGTSFHGIEFAQ